MKKVLFCGCSFVYGVGLPLHKQDPDLFCNILSATNKNLIGKEQINISVGGNSNERIFIDSAREILTGDYEYVFVCWTSFPRYIFHTTDSTDIKRVLPLNPWSSSSMYNNEFRDRLLTLNHESVYNRDLSVFADTLLTIAKTNNTKVFFLNMFLPYGSAQLMSTYPWLNPLMSFNESKKDLGSDGSHPGPLTHKLFAQLLNNKLNEYIT